MRVLFVSRDLTVGGVETVLRARLETLPAYGIEAHAWFFRDLGGGSVFDGLDARVHVGTAPDSMRFARAERFDLVCSIDTEEILREAPALRMAVECHSPYLENIEYLRQPEMNGMAGIIVPSDHQRYVVQERVGDRTIHVVPNPVRDIFLTPVTDGKTTVAVPPRPVVAWVGRLDDLKNWRGFLRIAGELRDHVRDLEIWLIGAPVDSWTEAEVMATAAGEGVLDRMKRLRGVEHRIMPRLLDAVRDSGGVVVSTSRGESFGMAVAEAMARGCAVAVPASPPLSDIVTHSSSGVWIDIDDPRAAAAALADLLADAELRRYCGANAARLVRKRFSGQAVAVALSLCLRALATVRT